MTPDDLSLRRSIATPRLSPDGRRAVYVVGRVDVELDETTTQLHLIDLETGEDRPLTAGPKDSSPQWSPDGGRIAFVRAGTDEPGQLALIDPDGGEARLATAVPEGVTAPVWTPDGATVVVTASRYRDGDDELDAAERARRPRRITELGYRHDGEGWLHDKVKRVYAVDVDLPLTDDGVTPLTPDDVDVGSHVVASDGRVVFESARQPGRETSSATMVWAASLDGSGTDPDGLVQLTGPRSMWGLHAGVDGEVLLIGHDDPDAWPSPPRLHRLTRDGEIADLTPELDRDVVDAVALADGGALALVEDRGAVVVHHVPANGGTSSVVVGGAQTVLSLDSSADGSVVVFAATHPEDPGELWLARDGQQPTVLTAHNEQLRERLLPVEHVTFERDDVVVDAWMVLPAGDTTDLPLLMNIHGGPTAQYGFAYFDEFQVYADAGYAVVGCNPRGSSGRGEQWARAVVGVWGQDEPVDVLDLEAAVDAALGHSDRISASRLGIMGGSYGGYATARLLARTDRYRSAIVERGLLNWVSFSGTSDIGPYFDRLFLGVELGEDAAEHWSASPVRTAARISTPTLVLHSLEDYRCPVEQALQLFQALRRAGVESELVLFPDEGHELSRSGSPRHRRERFDVVLDWHDRHLGVVRAPDEGQSSHDVTG